jgi:hypothetical protein
MARRDLSRTVIEGGRYRHNKWERRQSHGTGRAREREWLDAVEIDADIAEERAVRERPRVHRMFYDKLAVTRRWLRSRVGRPWSSVYSELMARFDPRTVAGRHIVFDHMLREIRGAIENEMWRTYKFEIDDHGILRAANRRRKPPKPPAWTNGRWATKRDRQWWWAGNRLVERCARRATCRYHHLDRDGVPYHYTRYTLLEPMTPGDVRRLLAMPPRDRGVLLLGTWPRHPEHARLAMP